MRHIILCFVIVFAAAGCRRADASATISQEQGGVTETTGASPRAGAPAGYIREVHRGTQLEFDIPVSWNRETHGDVMVITTPGVGLELVAATGGLEARADEKAMLAAVGRTLKNAKLTSPMKSVSQHGLTGFAASGKGQKNGAEVDWFTSAVGDGHGHAILALGFYRPDTSEEARTQMVHVLDSIQPVR